MAEPLWRSARAPQRPVPAPPPADVVNGMESAQQLLKSFEKLARKGGTFSTKPDPRPYVFYGNGHVSVSQVIQDNLWRFKLSATSRDLLDHMTTHHDREALVKMTQGSLAAKFGCSQSKVSRAIGQLSSHNFTWKERRGLYRLNPLYAYRWGSEKQRELVSSLKPILLEREIVIPTVRKEATR